MKQTLHKFRHCCRYQFSTEHPDRPTTPRFAECLSKGRIFDQGFNLSNQVIYISRLMQKASFPFGYRIGNSVNSRCYDWQPDRAGLN